MDNRLQEIVDNLDKFKVGLDDPFRFKCRGCYVGQDSRIPIAWLQPKGVNRACPFLGDKRCRVYEVKPVVCALYPVGRILMAEKKPEEGEEPSYEAGYILNQITRGSLKKALRRGGRLH